LGELLIQSLPLRIVQSSIAGLNRKFSTTVNQIINPGKPAISYASKIRSCFDIADSLSE